MEFTDLLDNVTQGDCLDVMKFIPDKSIDMILCDLPYGTTQNKWDSVSTKRAVTSKRKGRVI